MAKQKLRFFGQGAVWLLAVSLIVGKTTPISARVLSPRPVPETGVCVPTASAPSHSNFAGALRKKLSRDEFGNLALNADGEAVLPKDSELDVVVDLHCLKDPRRGARTLDWLKEAARPASGFSGKNKSSDLRSFAWRLDEDQRFEELQNRFEAEPCVKMVSPQGWFSPTGLFNDPLFEKQEHLPAVRFNDAFVDFRVPMMVRKPVVIAVIDSGVDFSHPELTLNQWENPREIAGNNIDDDLNGYIDDIGGFNFADGINDPGPQGDWPENRHGTHVAALAAGRIDNHHGGIGLHGLAKIMALNVFGSNGYSRSSILENAIRYAADNHADIINLSLGGREFSRSMKAALEYAIRHGSLIVSAAGNDGIEICANPASFDFISPAVYGSSLMGMIVTGSIDSSTGRLSRFSNFSKTLVEIAAPGAFSSEGGSVVGLLSAIPNARYAFLAGTSMAAPVLSGAAALAVSWLRAYGYVVTPQRLKTILRLSSKKNPELAHQVQEGRVLDLVELASYLKIHYPPSPASSPISPTTAEP